MAVPYVCVKCGAAVPAGAANAAVKCGVCGSSDTHPRKEDAGWRWFTVSEWFVLVAAVMAGVSAFINS
jgi:ribosomal protein L40E